MSSSRARRPRTRSRRSVFRSRLRRSQARRAAAAGLSTAYFRAKRSIAGPTPSPGRKARAPRLDAAPTRPTLLKPLEDPPAPLGVTQDGLKNVADIRV